MLERIVDLSDRFVHAPLQAAHALVDGREEEVALRGEAAVDARFSDPEDVGDVLEVGVAVARAGKDLGGGREDPLTPGIVRP
jgi:hypothetical protein